MSTDLQLPGAHPSTEEITVFFCWCYRYLTPQPLLGTTWWVPLCVFMAQLISFRQEQQPRCWGKPPCAGWELHIWPAPRFPSHPWCRCGSLSACSTLPSENIYIPNTMHCPQKWRTKSALASSEKQLRELCESFWTSAGKKCLCVVLDYVSVTRD